MTAPTTTVLLIRHGKTTTTGEILPGRTPGLYLNEEGLQQAKKTAEFLAHTNDGISVIYSSPMERAHQTAQVISEHLDKNLIVSEDAIEADFGEWTGKKLEDLRKLPEWQIVQKTPSEFRFPHGESLKDMQQRIVSEVERLTAAHSGETIVLVSHADVIKAALAHYLEMNLDSFQKLTVSPCSISALQIGETSRVVCINQTANGMPNSTLG